MTITKILKFGDVHEGLEIRGERFKDQGVICREMISKPIRDNEITKRKVI